MGSEVKSMEIKKTETASTTEATSTKRKARDFVADIKDEISKVQWTTKEELITYVKIVVITTFVFGMTIYLMDLFFQAVLNGLSALISWIA